MDDHNANRVKPEECTLCMLREVLPIDMLPLVGSQI
jgi:hypothetical protein